MALTNLATPILEILERTRTWYDFFITGYIVMPEHVHLLIGEPERAKLSIALQMLKQNAAGKLRPVEGVPFWEPRYYDFNIRSETKRVEKLGYIRRNPVHRGLVERLEDWFWSSFNHYATGIEGRVESNLNGPRENVNEMESSEVWSGSQNPTLSHKTRPGWGTLSIHFQQNSISSR